MTRRPSLCLYAVVPADGVPRARIVAIRGLDAVAGGSLLAVVGRAPPAINEAVALAHDRVVGRVLDRCAGVVPFRAGVNIPSQAAVRELLLANEARLRDLLARVSGRVEMGLKVKWPDVAGPTSTVLEPFHALAPDPADRRERTSPIYDGAYLMALTDVARFWDALKHTQERWPDLPVLGSGPWAPYSFCDVTLRPGGKATEVTCAAD